MLSQVVNYTFTTVSSTSSNSSEYIYSNLAAGTYAIQAGFGSLGSLTYQSDIFSCPSYYNPNFPFTSQQALQACGSTTTTTTTTTTEDNSTRNRNIALITVFTFVAVVGLAILIVFLAKKSAAAGASTAGNESSQINIQNANSSNPNTAQVNQETIIK